MNNNEEDEEIERILNWLLTQDFPEEAIPQTIKELEKLEAGD